MDKFVFLITHTRFVTTELVKTYILMFNIFYGWIKWPNQIRIKPNWAIRFGSIKKNNNNIMINDFDS